MALVGNPQPGITYKVIALDNKIPHGEVVFTFNNALGGKLDVTVNGQQQTIGAFSDLVKPWAAEVHTYP